MWTDYELIDTGNGKKLERFGKYTFIRPDSQAIWSPKHTWKADAVFDGNEDKGGHWKFFNPVPARWATQYQDIKFWCQPTPFRHLGVFPEQGENWQWMLDQKPKKVLNLFAYTGIISLLLSKTGCEVTHVDASKKSVQWAKDNQMLSNLQNSPIRWIVDDVGKFVEREARRNNLYDGIILDPPKYGRGPEGEIWKLEESLALLFKSCQKVLSPNPKFVICTTYALKLSSISLNNLMEEIFAKKATHGQLLLTDHSSRQLSTAIYSRISF